MDNRNQNIDSRYSKNTSDTNYSRYLIIGGLLVLALVVGAMFYNNYRGDVNDAANLSPAAGYGSTTGTDSNFMDRYSPEDDATGTVLDDNN